MAIVKLIKDLASVIAFALGFLTAESYYTDLWIRLYEPGRFIGIWDDVGASFSQTDAWEPFSLRNTVKANDDNNARLESLMSALPPQADGVARVFLQELFDDDVRDNDSTSGTDFPYKFPPLRVATVGFLSLISNQYWASPLRWYRIESCNFIESKRGSPQVRWVNVVRYLRFQVIDNRLQEFITCRTLVRTDWTGNNRRFPEEQFGLYQATATFATQLCELDAMYRPFKNTSDWMKAFSLQFCHANLLLYARFLLVYETAFGRQQGLLDPTRAELQEGNVGKVTADHQLIQKFSEIGDRMLVAIESLVEILQSATRSQVGSSTPISRTSNIPIAMSETPQLAAIELEIRLYCKQLRDLGALLYDFFGVVTLLGALALCFILLLDFVNFVTGPYLVQFDMEMNRNAMYREEVAKRKQQLSTYVHFRILASILWWLGLGLFCIILVVSFLIGMFRDISLGAKVLGYGLAVVSFPAVIALSLTFLLSLMGELVRRRRKARKAAQESPRVERRRQGMGADEENASPVNPPEPTTRMAELASAAANHAESEDEVANE
ncbi:uncharacterized protein CLUP02_12030 [Colletotrichum lupini]|uniref:Uncharacterized protein n=1 Tax=Colletotrichum lupini TaxID=145971 RepID=A0A9Q8WK23_9PEZI|nr:uncharacterized protein CLUP02_12030 [Colletotrichum lupini]UQC86528.1 hypothetical protein CLUP02_12030 [Colletotrichum lupini]